MRLASAVMVAWLEKELRPGPETDQRLQRFWSWIEAVGQEQLMDMVVKPPQAVQPINKRSNEIPEV